MVRVSVRGRLFIIIYRRSLRCQHFNSQFVHFYYRCYCCAGMANGGRHNRWAQGKKVSSPPITSPRSTPWRRRSKCGSMQNPPFLEAKNPELLRVYAGKGFCFTLDQSVFAFFVVVVGTKPFLDDSFPEVSFIYLTKIPLAAFQMVLQRNHKKRCRETTASTC